VTRPGSGVDRLIEPSVLGRLPSRGSGSTKFSSGRVLVIGGSEGLTAAPCLTSEAAMRAGALCHRGDPTLAEPDLRGTPAGGDDAAAADRDAIWSTTACRRSHDTPPNMAVRLVLGPGLGRSEAAFELAREVARAVDMAMVLRRRRPQTHMRAALTPLAARSAPTVLTPHAGELARLLRQTARLSRLGAFTMRAGGRDGRRGRRAQGRRHDCGGRPTGRWESAAAAALPGHSGHGDVLSGVVAALLGVASSPSRLLAPPCGRTQRPVAWLRLSSARTASWPPT